ncbi:MAG: HprK-related kinase A, partial [Ectothiorhodospira sp.]
PVHDTAKGTVAHMRPGTSSVQRVLEPVPPRWVVFPRYQPDAGLEVAALPRLEVFRGLLENAFNYSLLGATGFRVMADLVERVAGCSVHYGDLDAVMAHIEAMAAGKG